MKTFKDLEKEFVKEYSAYANHGRLDKEPFSDWAKKFLRSAIQTAFEETRVAEKHNNFGFNTALSEVNKRQEEFLGKKNL